MQAIILAGGFGTRLQSTVGVIPKPVAPVAGRPFLCWLLEYMAAQGITEAVVCLHYMPEMIRGYLGNRYAGIKLTYAVEETPLGTGGAIRHALSLLNTEKPVFVLNGDSLVHVNYIHMLQTHYRKHRLLTMATSQVGDCSRYSVLNVSGGQVQSYKARGDASFGTTSNGFYIMSPALFDGVELDSTFSFEADFLAHHIPVLKPASYNAVEYFIDIGVPEDYARAQTEIPALLQQRLAA